MTDSVEQVSKSISVPANSSALADGIQKLILAVISNHKQLSGVAAISADVIEAVKDLGPILGEVGLLEADLKADPLGVAEAMSVAGFSVVRQLRAS